jgi:hypothetical protein
VTEIVHGIVTNTDLDLKKIKKKWCDSDCDWWRVTEMNERNEERVFKLNMDKRCFYLFIFFIRGVWVFLLF